jgi:hypothetical protein
MFDNKLRPDGSFAAEDDSLLHRPVDDDVEDPDIEWDNEIEESDEDEKEDDTA